MEFNNTNLVGVYTGNTPTKTIFKGRKFVWGSAPDQHYMKGKFLDNTTEKDWWYYKQTDMENPKNYSGLVKVDISEYVNPDTKEFVVPFDPNYSYYNMFGSCKLDKLIQIPVTPGVTNLSNLFYFSSIEEVDTSYWNTCNVTDFNNGFSHNDLLKRVDLSSLNLKKCKDFNYMFNGCYELEDVNLTGVPLTGELRLMFYSCYKLKKVVGIQATDVINIDQCFDGCWELQEVDLSKVDVSNITSFQRLFYRAKALHTINLGNWDFINGVMEWISVFYSAFYETSSLRNIIGPVYNIQQSIDLSYSPYLTNDSVMVLINGMVEVEKPQTLTLHSNVKSQLTEEQIAIATSKGWTIA